AALADHAGRRRAAPARRAAEGAAPDARSGAPGNRPGAPVRRPATDRTNGALSGRRPSDPDQDRTPADRGRRRADRRAGPGGEDRRGHHALADPKEERPAPARLEPADRRRSRG